MEAELGFFLLIFVAMGASCSAVLHWYRRAAAKPIMLEHQLATSHLISLASVVCLLLLIVCFIQDNFALEYVVTHSNSQLPTAYKVAAAWGAPRLHAVLGRDAQSMGIIHCSWFSD